jgi:anti-sigma B factor antagonist
MTTNTRRVGLVTVVDISGRIVLGAESAAFRDKICDLLHAGHTQILLNLSDVDFIDSSGLGVLISSLTSARKQGGELKLLNLPAKIRYLMEITRLDTFFDVTNDEATGVKSFARSKAITA